LLIVVAVAVQIVLWTNLPRGIVVLQIEKQLGLRLTVKSFSTGWLGNTRLNDVTIALPLADKAFLDVPVMRVKNTSLFGLALGQAVEVRAIELDRPHLSVWQDSGGRWNLQEVAELLARAGGKKSGEESAADSSSPQMPDVRLNDGVISIIDNKNRTLNISPLSVIGQRDTAVSWKYDIQIPPRLSIKGRLVPGGNWGHEVAVKLQDVGAWAAPWMKNFPPIVIDANWRGALSETGIGGRLDITKAAIDLKTGSAQAYGAIAAGYGGGVLTLKPDNLLLKTGQHALPQLTVASGSMNYLTASGEIKVEQLLVNLFGGPARVSADYDLNAKSGRIDAGWEKLVLPGKVTHSGSFSATLRQPFPNQVIVDGNLKSTGDTPSGPWTAAAKFNATGESFTHFGWTFDAGKFRWDRRDEGIVLDGLTLAGDLKNDRLAVGTIRLPQPDVLNGNASYEFTGSQRWEINLRGQHWPFHPIAGTELGFETRVRGAEEQVVSDAGKKMSTQVIHLDNFLLKSPDGQFSANGTYTVGIPKPVDINVTISNAPGATVPVAVASAPQDKILSGTIEGHVRISGTLMPAKVQVSGRLDGRELDIRGRHLGQISVVVSDLSHIDSDGVFIFTDALKLFGGNWDLDGIYLFDSGGLNVDVAMKDVKLKDVAAVAEQPGISGSVDGKLSLFVPGLHPQPASIQVPPSSFTIRNLQAHGLSIDQADATLAINHGILQLNPIRVSHRDGRGGAYLTLDLNALRHIDLGATVSNWPIDIPGAAAGLTASVSIPHAAIDLPNPSSPDLAQRKLHVTAPQINLSASTTLRGDQLGNIVAYAGVDGQKVDVRAVHMKLLGGRLDGQAYADPDRPLNATAEFTWEKIDFKKLALIFPQLNQMSGEMTGSVRLAPATVPRPREPLALVITNQFRAGAWRTLPIQDFRIAAYVGPNQQSPGAGWRVVLEDSNIDPSFIHADKGTIALWGRFGTHANGSSSQAQLTLQDIDLNTAIHAIDPESAAMPGKLSGTIMLIRVPAPPQNLPGMAFARMFPGQPSNPFGDSTPPPRDQSTLRLLIEPVYAEGALTLSRTNLLNFGPFAFLYNAANLFHNDRTALGDGNVEFHLERGKLSIEHLRYFNRGTEIRAVATIGQIWNIPNSPISGTGFVTGRPLKDLKLPFLSDFDSVFVAIQSSLALTGARIDGTLKNHRLIGPIGVTDMTDEMRRFLVGDVKKDLQAQSSD
jgi:hypothetical protein